MSFICIYMLGKCFYSCQSLFCFWVMLSFVYFIQASENLVSIKTTGILDLTWEWYESFVEYLDVEHWCFSYIFQTQFNLKFGETLKLTYNCRHWVVWFPVCPESWVTCRRISFSWFLDMKVAVINPAETMTDVGRDLFIIWSLKFW